MITIILTAFASFRHAFYETFLHIHIALVSLILAALWIHLEGHKELKYLKAVIALWVVERLMRLFSLLCRNIGRTTTTAEMEELPGDAIRITLRLAHPLRFKPGQHIYLTIPSVGLWTSHPFSIAWSSSPPNHHHDLENGNTTPPKIEQYTPASPQHTISLLLRRRAGFTSHLHHRTLKSRLSVPAFLEGPYGHPPSLSSYGTILLFAGGIGITAHLTLLRHLVANHAPSTSAVRRVTLIWIIRSPEHLEWIRPWLMEIMAMPKRSDLLRIQVFVTQPTGGTETHRPSPVSASPYPLFTSERSSFLA